MWTSLGDQYSAYYSPPSSFQRFKFHVLDIFTLWQSPQMSQAITPALANEPVAHMTAEI